ncbi:Major facilitator superfamily (MFS) profile domain-containing protein, partial [Dysosmobacter welbionis]
RAPLASRLRINSISWAVCRFPARPSASSTARLSTVPPTAAHWSKRLRPSRRAPSARRLNSSAPSAVRSIC